MCSCFACQLGHVLPALHTAKTKGTYDLYGEEVLKSTIDSGGLPLAGQLH
jgi:hypothetical protein